MHVLQSLSDWGHWINIKHQHQQLPEQFVSMCSSACLSEAFACQCAATERQWAPAATAVAATATVEGWLFLHPVSPPWTSIYTSKLVQNLSVCSSPMEHGPLGNKSGPAEEEELNLFQYNTPILIESEVSDPEKTKLAEMTF